MAATIENNVPQLKTRLQTVSRAIGKVKALQRRLPGYGHFRPEQENMVFHRDKSSSHGQVMTLQHQNMMSQHHNVTSQHHASHHHKRHVRRSLPDGHAALSRKVAPKDNEENETEREKRRHHRHLKSQQRQRVSTN